MKISSSSTSIISCIILAIWTTTPVFAQGGCDAKTSCNECLESSCDWYNGAGCSDDSAIIMDISRYTINDSSPETVTEVCQRAANDQADYSLCIEKFGTDCTSCVELVLSDGVSTCQWAEGFCIPECGMMGCGVTICPPIDLFDDGTPLLTEDTSDAPTTTVDTSGGSNCSAKTSCGECVGANDADGASLTCAWVPALLYESTPCTAMSCDLGVDPNCYSREFSVDGSTANEICEGSEGSPEAGVFTDNSLGSAASARNHCSVLLLFVFALILL